MHSGMAPFKFVSQVYKMLHYLTFQSHLAVLCDIRLENLA